MESLTYASEREDHPRGSIVSSPTCNYFFREHFNTSKMVGYDSQGGQITLTVLVNKKTYRLDSRTETFHAKQDILHLAFYQYVGQKETFLSQNNYNTGHCTHTHTHTAGFSHIRNPYHYMLTGYNRHTREL